MRHSILLAVAFVLVNSAARSRTTALSTRLFAHSWRGMMQETGTLRIPGSAARRVRALFYGFGHRTTPIEPAVAGWVSAATTGQKWGHKSSTNSGQIIGGTAR